MFRVSFLKSEYIYYLFVILSVLFLCSYPLHTYRHASRLPVAFDCGASFYSGQLAKRAAAVLPCLSWYDSVCLYV